MSQKYCPKCKSTKSTSEFGTNRARKDGLQSYCNICRTNYNKNWYSQPENRTAQLARTKTSNARLIQKIRDNITQYLYLHPCVDCGLNDIEVLEFDHRNPVEKYMNVSDMVKNHCSWSKIQLEISKCDVRCANCHRKRTIKQFGWYKTITGVAG